MRVPPKKWGGTENLGKNNNRKISKFNENYRAIYPRISMNSKQHKHTQTHTHQENWSTSQGNCLKSVRKGKFDKALYHVLEQTLRRIKDILYALRSLF